MPSKDRNRAQKQTVLRLEKQLKLLQGDAGVLQKEHAEVATHSTLHHIADLFAWLVAEGGGEFLEETTDSEQLQEHQYQQLFLSADSKGGSSSSSAISWTICGLDDDSDKFVAPPKEPLLQLRLMLSQPPYSPRPFTFEQMLREFRDDVQEMALHLHKLQALQKSAPSQGPGLQLGTARRPLAALKTVLQRRLWVITSLAIQRDTTVFLSTATLVNLETGDVLPQLDEQHHLWAMQQLGLTQQQLQRMATCARVYRRLLNPVQDEAKQLQLELGNSNASGLGSSACCAAACTAALAAADDAAVRQHIAATELHWQNAQRLSAVMQKGYLIKLCLGAHLYGCLTWQQLGMLFVLMAPYCPAVTIVGNVVEQLWHQQ